MCQKDMKISRHKYMCKFQYIYEFRYIYKLYLNYSFEVKKDLL